MNHLLKVWHAGIDGRNPVAALTILLAGIPVLVALLTIITGTGEQIFYRGILKSYGGHVQLQFGYLIAAIAILGMIVAVWPDRSEWDGVRTPFSIKLIRRLAVTIWLLVMLLLGCVAAYDWDAFARAWLGRVEAFSTEALPPTLVAFSVLWGLRVVAHHVAQIARMRRLKEAIGSARGLLGACLCAGASAWVAGRYGTRLGQSPAAFYVLGVPALIGFGWTASWPGTGSRVFWAGLLFVAFGMAQYTMTTFNPWYTSLNCKREDPGEGHGIVGRYARFEDEPWRWRLVLAENVVFVPAALGQLTVNYVREPLASIRCYLDPMPD